MPSYRKKTWDGNGVQETVRDTSTGIALEIPNITFPGGKKCSLCILTFIRLFLGKYAQRYGSVLVN
eukprot:m.495844 g.495844  ORF g.495844 m.495844 type:complete len:66 (-) comp21802_c2_seq22:2315-2512(-)